MRRKTSAMACGITAGLLLLLCVVPGTAAAQRGVSADPCVPARDSDPGGGGGHAGDRGHYPRVLAENLSLLIPTERVVLYPWPRNIDPDYQVIVEVLQFERGPGSQVVLAARWSLLDRDGKELALPLAST